MSLKLKETRRDFDYMRWFLYQEWETHRGGRIIISIQDSQSERPSWRYMEELAASAAREHYYDLLRMGKDLSKDYFIEG